MDGKTPRKILHSRTSMEPITVMIVTCFIGSILAALVISLFLQMSLSLSLSLCLSVSLFLVSVRTSAVAQHRNTAMEQA